MRTLQGLTLGVIALALVLAASATAIQPVTITTTTYAVSGSAVPGATTGLVLNGDTVTVTATGAVCPYSGAVCPGPNGNPGYDTSSSAYGGFPAPGAPAWGLVARVGSGAWTHVGSGPTTVSGTGELQFAFNDDFLGDNSGSFAVTVTAGSGSRSGCTPGWGNGDENHTHAGPPGQTDDVCRPGWGNGDENHDHGGPPGQTDAGTTATSSTGSGPGNGNGKAKGHAKH
jgi:hypothetical protein